METKIDKYGILKMITDKLGHMTVTGLDQMKLCMDMAQLLEILTQMLQVEDKNREESEMKAEDDHLN